MRWLKANERRTGFKLGINVDSQRDVLSNLRFADDVLLIAQCKSDARKMIKHLQEAAADSGLKLNYDKTKILSFGEDRDAMVPQWRC